VDLVAGAATADVVDGCRMLHQALLLSQLFIEAEDGTFLLAVQVAGTATSAHEVGVGWRRSELGNGRRTGGVRASGDVLGVYASDVASTTSAGMVVVAGRDGRVRLGDLVGRHIDVLRGVDVLM